MMRSKIALVALAVIGAVVLAAPAFAATVTFTGTITTFTGGGSGLPTTATGLPGADSMSFNTGTFGFTVPAAVWVNNSTAPAGFTANASPNSIYVIRTVTNTSNTMGTFGPGAGPSGGFGGALGSGSAILVELGIVPLPNVFGALVLPINVGSTGSVVATAAILANLVTVTVVATGWTTGVITINDQTMGAPPGDFVTTGMATGTNGLGANGGPVTLVTPFLILIRGASTENRAGYARIQLFIPEPGSLLLLGSGVLGLLALGRRRNA